MRMTVTGEEVLQPQHVAVVGPADNDRTARAGFQQAHAAQDQRAHDALAKLGLGNEQGAQLRRRNDDDPDRFGCDGVDEGRTTAKLRQLAHEASGLMGHDQRALAAVRLEDVNLPREDDHQPGGRLTHARQRLPGSERAHLAEAAHTVDLLRQQRREHLGPARGDDRLSHVLSSLALTVDGPVWPGDFIARALGAEYQVWVALRPPAPVRGRQNSTPTGCARINHVVPPYPLAAGRTSRHRGAGRDALSHGGSDRGASRHFAQLHVRARRPALRR